MIYSLNNKYIMKSLLKQFKDIIFRQRGTSYRESSSAYKPFKIHIYVNQPERPQTSNLQTMFKKLTN